MRAAVRRRIPAGHLGVITGCYVVLLVAQSVLILAGSRAQWWGWWPAAMARSTSVVVLGAPLLMGVAGYLAGSARRHRMSAWVRASGVASARMLWPAALLALVPAVAVLAAAALVVSFATGGLAAGVTSAWAALAAPVSAGVYLVMSAALAVLVGTRLPTWWAVPAAVFLGYALQTAPAYLLAFDDSAAAEGVQLLASPVVGSDWASSTRDPLLMGVQTSFYALVTAAVVVWGWQRRPRLGRSLAAAASVAAAVVIVGGVGARPIPGAEEIVCVGEQPRVCATRSFAGPLPHLADVLHRNQQRLPAFLRPEVVVGEDVLSAGIEPGSAATHTDSAPLVFSARDDRTVPSRTVNEREVEAAYIDAILPCVAATGEDPGGALATRIWWRLQLGLPLDGSVYVGEDQLADLPGAAVAEQEARQLAAQSPAEQARWFATHEAALLDCRNTPRS